MYRERMYSPGEVRQLLSRAAAIEETNEDERRSEGAPLTFDQIVSVAREAGISEESLRRAATEPVNGPRAARHEGRWPLSISGAPAKIAVERTVRGYVGPSNHAQLVRAMRRALGEAGNAQVLGESLTWATTMKGRQVHVMIEPLESGEVTVRIDEDLRGFRAGLLGGIVGGVGGGGFGLVVPLLARWMSGAVTQVAMIAWLLIVFLVAREVYVARYRRRDELLHALADELADHVHGASRPAELRARVADRQTVRAEDEQAAEEEAYAIGTQASTRRRNGNVDGAS